MEYANKKNIIIIAVIVLAVLGGWLIFGKGGSSAPTSDFTGSIVGTWQNVEIPRLVREFKDGGTLVDTFDGSEAASGTWDTFDNESAPQISGVFFDNESVYLKINLTGNEKDNIYFQVLSVTADSLELVYLGPGGTMKFTRIQE